MENEKTKDELVFEKIYTVKKEITKDEFLRDLICTLARLDDAPADVLECEFGEVQEFESEVIIGRARVIGDVTATIGNRNTFGEIRWEPSLKHYDEEKEIKIYNKPLISANGKIDRTDYFSPALYLDKVDPKNIVEEGTGVLSQSALENAAPKIAESVISMPYADYVKDTNIDVKDVSFSSLILYRLPMYSVEFTYKGQTYNSIGVAYGRGYARVDEYPRSTEKIDPDVVAEKASRTPRILEKLCWFGFALLSIAAFVLSGFKIAWAWVLSLAAYVGGICFYKKKIKAYNKSLKEPDPVKYQALVNALKKRNMPAPCESEKADLVRLGGHELRGSLIGPVITGVFLAIQIIICLVVAL